MSILKICIVAVFIQFVFLTGNLFAADYFEVNGLVVIEAENLTGVTSNWKQETSFAPFTGASYIRWNGANSFSVAGLGVIGTKIKITNPGVYCIQMRNKVGYGVSTTEHNDTWMKFPGITEFYGKSGSVKVYPKGSGKTPYPEGASNDGYLKVYCHGTTDWTWLSKTNDKNPYKIYVEFDAPGEYQFSLSGRSQHHCIDRIVLYKSNVSESYATNLAREETVVEPTETRVAVLADGNSPDPDDIGATAVSLAIMRAMEAEKRLVYYAHSCDLIRNNTKISAEQELARQTMMQTSCDGTAEKWGGFEHITFYNCRTQQTLATEKLTEAINVSTTTSPLAIIEAGEPDVIYDAIAAAEPEKRQFVTIITHHIANDESADDPNKNLSNIEADFTTVKVERIPDQNTNLQTPIANWDWAKNHWDERITWLYSQGEIAEQDNVVSFQKGKFDCSDAGMVYYHLTGEKNPTVAMLQSLFTKYVGEKEPVKEELSKKTSLHISFEDAVIENWVTDGDDFGVVPAIIDGVNSRAGLKVMALDFTTSSSGHHVQNTIDKIVVPDQHYFHMIAYTASTEPDFGYAWPTVKLGDWAPTPTLKSHDYALFFEQRTTSRQNVQGDSLNCYPRLRSKAQGGACVIYYDDIVLYSDINEMVDLEAPEKAEDLTFMLKDENALEMNWVEGVDEMTGVKATFVLRTANSLAEVPELKHQAAYSTANDSTSISEVGDWRVLAKLEAGITSYTDNNRSTSESYQYAIVHKDLAYNYSSALVGRITSSVNLNDKVSNYQCIGLNGVIQLSNLVEKSQLSIYNLKGVKVYEKQVQDNEVVIQLKPGLYVVKHFGKTTKVLVK